ncbi:hypothetical protein NW754_003805 [Fusarium falciforme]|nr:hypothetical protein NW754_003805 [Fusarium falciforme]
MHELEEHGNSSSLVNPFRKDKLVLVPPKTKGGERRWVSQDECFWRGESWPTQSLGLERLYPDLETFFRDHLNVWNAGIDHLIKEAAAVPTLPQPALPGIQRLFLALEYHVKAHGLSEDQKKALLNTKMFPTTSTVTDETYEYLSSATVNDHWLIADRSYFREPFQSLIPVLAFAAEFISKIMHLLVKLGLKNRFLSDLALFCEGTAYLECDYAGDLRIYLHSGYEKEATPCELAEQLRNFFNIWIEHRDLVMMTLSDREERLDRIFQERDIASFQEDSPESGELDGEEGEYRPGQNPAPSKKSRLGLTNGSRFNRLLSHARFSPSFFKEAENASNSLPTYVVAVARATQNALGRPVELRTFAGAMTLPAVKGALRDLEFTQMTGAVIGTPAGPPRMLDRVSGLAKRDSEVGEATARKNSVHSEPHPDEAAPSQDVSVLVHVSDVRKEPKIQFLTDPWDLFKDGQLILENVRSYQARLELRPHQNTKEATRAEVGFDAVQFRASAEPVRRDPSPGYQVRKGNDKKKGDI